MHMHFGFSGVGRIRFLIPMIINILYVIFPPKINNEKERPKNKKLAVLEIIEQFTRIAYVVILCIFVSNKSLSYKSPLLYISIVFLILYYIVWIRYFIGGRDVKLLGEKFLFIPLPLSIFPVLYFIFASLWMNNYMAAVVMIIFGIAHNIISYENLFHSK